MGKMTKLAILGTTIIILTLSSCGDKEFEDSYGLGNEYMPTDMYLDGYIIYQYYGDNSKLVNREKSISADVNSGTCENFVYNLDGINYYYDTYYCDELFNKEYMIYASDDRTGEYSGYSLTSYIYTNESKFTSDEISNIIKLPIIKSKEADYIPTGAVIAVDGVVKDVLEYSQSYIEENQSCMNDYEKIIFDDVDYNYTYSYRSCSSDKTAHALVHGSVWNERYEAYLPTYVGVDEYINEYSNYLTQCDIDNLGITNRVPKA